MDRSRRLKYILDYFQQTMPHVTTELEFSSVFQLLVATVLSAQCTDKRVNQVTPDLFSRYPDAASFASADVEDVLSYIRSVSYPNSKARHIVELSRLLMEKFSGEVPSTFDDLLSLPGVGRKTANVILAVAFSEAAMPVDTHVFRVSHRLGLVPKKATTPFAVERSLVCQIPKHLQADAHHWMLLHGRYTCTSRHPHCERCPFDGICPKNMDF